MNLFQTSMVYKCLSKFWMYILSYIAILIPVTLYLATIEFNVFVFVIWLMVTVCLLIFALGNYLDSKITSSQNLPGTLYNYLDSQTLANVKTDSPKRWVTIVHITTISGHFWPNPFKYLSQNRGSTNSKWLIESQFCEIY